MKGISTILAMILIVIIVVALIGLTYTFAVGLFSTTTSGATGQTEAVTKRLDQSVTFVTNPSCTSNTDSWTINFVIKHTGVKYNIGSNEIDVLVGNTPITTVTGFGTTMTPGETKYLSITNETAVNWFGTQTLTVSVPAAPISKTIDCPALA
jgi:FlaG/FlaF family flagellin (archaellin)